MQLKLVMAYGGDLGWRIRSGSIIKWHKTEGEEVGYGDDLFDMKVEAGPKLSLKHSFVVRVRSSDRGTLRKIFAKKGELRESGDVLALLTTVPDEFVDEASPALNEASAFRAVADRIQQESAVETGLQQRTFAGTDFILCWSESGIGNCIGIYCTRALPLDPMFGTAPLIQRNMQGRCCIIQESWLDLRSDLLIDYLNDYSNEQIDEVASRLNLSLWWLQPQWLDNTFRIESPDGKEEFPKTAVVLSIGADAGDWCFRHKKHGLRLPSSTIHKLEAEGLEWLRRNFAPAGLLSVDDFRRNFGTVIQTLQRETRAHVMVANAFTSAPRASDHNYRFLKDHPVTRRLELNLALADLSRELNFSILDVDRILKRSGIADQVDWESAFPSLYPVIAGEAYRILRDRGLVC